MTVFCCRLVFTKVFGVCWCEIVLRDYWLGYLRWIWFGCFDCAVLVCGLVLWILSVLWLYSGTLCGPVLLSLAWLVFSGFWVFAVYFYSVWGGVI